MEQPGDGASDGDSEGDVAAQALLIEQALREASDNERFASADVWLAAWQASRVLARLREVAPELVAAAEEEVGVRRA